MKRNIKLIALDMDGTLLGRDGKLSSKNKEAIKAAMNNGIHVVISTGRVFGALPKDVLCVPGIEYAVTSNGARVVRLEDQCTIYTNLIDEDRMAHVEEIIFRDNLLVELFYNSDVVVEKKCLDNLESYGLPREYSEYVLKTRTPVENLCETAKNNRGAMENINVNFNCMDCKEALWNELNQIEGITVTSSLPHNIEIGGATTSKGNGVAHLCEILGIKSEEVMACGDSHNDASMFEFAGLAVAMGNAHEDMKEIADFVTKTNDEDGVAFAIEKFVL